MKFTSFNDWLNEGIHKAEKKEDLFGCIMMDAKIDNWEEYHLDGISDDDLYLKPYDQSYGKEEQPHVTIIFGLIEEEIIPQGVADMIEANMQPLILPVDEIGIFEGDEYDIVKYNLHVTPQLQRYRDLFMKLPNVQEFPEYTPHITICYVKPGLGKKYERKLTNPFKVKFNKAVYSWHPNKNKKKTDNPDKTSKKVVNLDKNERKDKEKNY